MVDFRQPPAALRGEQRHPAPADNRPHDSGNGAGSSRRVEPMVVGREGSSDLPVLVNDFSSQSAADTVLLEPWMLSENDLPWLQILFKKKYPEGFDAITTEGWFRNVVLKTPIMFHPIRLTNSFLIAMLSCLPWTPSQFDCHIVCVCADDGHMWETAKLLRASINWARLRKCKRWNLTSDTDFDLEPMARRIGAAENTPRYYVDL